MKPRVAFTRPIVIFMFLTNILLSFPFLLYTIYPAYGMPFLRAFLNSVNTIILVIIVLSCVSFYIYQKLKPIERLINKPVALPVLSQADQQLIVDIEKRLKKVLTVIIIVCYICVGAASVAVNALREGLLRWATIRFMVTTFVLGPSVAYLCFTYIGSVMQRVKQVAGVYEFTTRKSRVSLRVQLLAGFLSLFLATSLILTFLNTAKQEYIVGISRVAWVRDSGKQVEGEDGYFTRLLTLARQSTDVAVKQEAERIYTDWEHGASSRQMYDVLYIWLVVFAFFMFGALIFISDLVSHIKGVKTNLQQIVDLKGDLRTFLVKTSNNELGEIQTLFNTLILNINHQFRNIYEIATGIISKVKAEKNNLQQLIKSNEEITVTARNVSSEVGNQTQITSQTAVDIKAVVNLMEKNMSKISEQAAAIEETSAALTELNTSVNSVAKITRKASDLGASLGQTSEQGLNLTKTVQESIKKINLSGEGINNIAKVISKIASDTNLLAMNAAIEAAHAGDFGQGFAIVADEIRILSESANTQTKQIVKILKDMQQSIKESVGNSQTLNNGIQAMIMNVRLTTDLIKEIHLASEEQASNVNENMQATRKLIETGIELKDIFENQKIKNKSLLDSSIRMESSVVKIKTVGKDQEDYFINLKNHYSNFLQFFASTEEQLLVLETELKMIKLCDDKHK